MAEGKNGFILYRDQIHTVSKLSDAQAGKLYKHILDYVNDKNPVTDDIVIQIAFEPIKQHLKRDLKLWEEKQKQRIEAARISAENRRKNKEKAEAAKKKRASANGRSTVVDESKKPLNETSQASTVSGSGSGSGIGSVSGNVKKSIEDRKADFKKSLSPFLEKYGKDLLNEFYKKWTEKNPRGRKMRFEKEKTFDVSLRLETWKKNSEKWNKAPGQKVEPAKDNQVKEKLDIM